MADKIETTEREDDSTTGQLRLPKSSSIAAMPQQPVMKPKPQPESAVFAYSIGRGRGVTAQTNGRYSQSIAVAKSGTQINIFSYHTKYVGVYSFRFSVRSFVRTFVCTFVRSFVFPSQGQSFCVKVYKTSYFEDHLMDFIHIWHDGRYRSKVFISTIPYIGLKFLSAPSPPRG